MSLTLNTHKMASVVIGAVYLLMLSLVEIGCNGYISYTVTSRRNATGHREILSDLKCQETQRNVQLEMQHRSFPEDGARILHITTIISIPESRAPAPGYELVPGLGWYRLHLNPVTWDAARLACEAEGAHLAILNSPEESNALKGIFARAPANIAKASYSHVASIGYSDLVEGNYRTLFGETLEQAGFSEWGKDQPNNAAGSNDSDSDCGGIDRSGKLNDLPCRSTMAYFCEIAL